MTQDIAPVAERLGLAAGDVVPVGPGKAKIALAALSRKRRGKGRVVLVSAITPTPVGEGKTTVSIALGEALSELGRRAAVCLRQPSMGPVFGGKGGGTGGGRAHLVPAEDINLHFTGDSHAVASAHNLLAALADNDLHFGGRLDARRVTWPRVLDIGDRALRHVVVGLGGPANGMPHESRFDITPSSEVMAVLCLARSLADLRERLSRLVVGRTRGDEPVTARDLEADGAMEALLATALQPNLVRTAGGTPAFVHGGAFANIAHGCSSVLATQLAGHYADDVVTEAGFGFDLGGEKFLHLKCPVAEVWPGCVVLVVTVRALAHHGGATTGVDAEAVERGLAHLDRQLSNVDAFGLSRVVALNVHADDPEDCLVRVERHCRARSVPVARVHAFEEGGAGACELSRRVAELLDASDGAPSHPRSLYASTDPFARKLERVACSLYGARSVIFTPEAQRDLDRFSRWGFGGLPPCVAKTPLSLSDDPTRPGVPSGFDLTVTSVRLSAGAGFLVALSGDVQSMPGLPHDPAARRIHLNADGRVVGLGDE